MSRPRAPAAGMRILAASASVSSVSAPSEAAPLAVDRVLPVAREVIARASVKPEALDLVVSMSISPDRVAIDANVGGPRLCHPLQKALGAESAFVFDMCDGDWSVAIEVARGFCREMGYKNVLLVRTECAKESLASDPDSRFRVPDGAGCLLLRPSEIATDDVEMTPSWSHADVPAAHLALLPWTECAAGDLRSRFRFPLTEEDRAALRRAALEPLRAFSTRQKPDHAIVESWVPGDVDAAAFEDVIGVGPAFDDRLGPFGLPYFADTFCGDGSKRVLSVTFNPFQTRYGYQWLSA